MPTYLVASDLSVRSDRALQRAFDLARRNAARLVVLSVVDDSLPDSTVTRLVAEARTMLDETLRGLSAAGQVECGIEVVTGDAAEQIALAVDRHRPDLLVLGLHRARPLFDDFRETTMQLIVRMGLCPTLLVRDPATHPYRRLLAAVDFAPAAAAAVAAARAVAPEAALEVIHALHVPFRGLLSSGDTRNMVDALRSEAEELCRDWCRVNALPDMTPEVEMVAGSLGEVVAGAIQARKPDLLVLGAHARNALARMVLGSFAAELMREPPVDLLIAPPKRP